MEKLEKIKQELNEINSSLETLKSKDLKDQEMKVDKKIKELIGIKNYYQKQQNGDLSLIKELMREAKSLKQEILDQKKERISILKKETPKVEKEKFLLPEEKRIKEIMALDISKDEKIRAIKTEILIIESCLECLQEEYQKLTSQKESKQKESTIKTKKERKEEKKQELERKKSGVKKEKKSKIPFTLKTEIELNKELKEKKLEMLYLKNILQSYKTFLAQLKNKTKKSIRNTNEKEVTEKNQENKYYYLILNELLNDDKNYFFIKRIVETNPHFINARKEGDPILFELVDRYIKNLKLELRNQKLVHENPKFFYELIKLFRQNPELVLTEAEENYFNARIKELTTYIEDKGYSNGEKIKKELTAMEEEKPMRKYILTKNYQEIMSAYAKNSKRLNLTREYLEKVASSVQKFIENFGEQSYPLNWYVAKQLNISVSDIINSEIPMDTIALEKTKYAFSFGFNKKYETYLRIHVVDTSILNGDFALKEMKERSPYTSKILSKKLKFKKGNTYPVITYQVKILENGLVENPKIFESKIKIDRVVRNEEMLDYREDNYLKNFFKYTKFLAKFYEINMEPISDKAIEKIYDDTLNFILKNYFEKNHLMAFYKTEIDFTPEEVYNLHYGICAYLSKLTREEVIIINRQLFNLKASCYFGTEALEESKMMVDTRNYLGYLNLNVLKNSLHGLCGGKQYEEVIKEFKECKQILNQGEFFLDYRNQTRLIRKMKQEEIENKKAKQE